MIKKDMKIFVSTVLLLFVMSSSSTLNNNAYANDLQTGTRVVITHSSPIPVAKTPFLPRTALLSSGPPYYVVAPGSGDIFKLSEPARRVPPKKHLITPDSGIISQSILVNFACVALAVTAGIIFKNFKELREREK